MRQLNVAIAGAGARAQQHVETLVDLPDHYRVVAVSDTRFERAQETASRLDAEACANPVEMLDRTRPDALFVVVPPDGHHPLAVAAAQRGVHVLCEVPISITLPLADLMIEACRRADVVLEICENVPRRPSERLKQDVVRHGLLGEVLLGRMQYTSGSYHGMSGVRHLLPGRPARVWGFRRTMPALPLVDFTGIEHREQDWECGYFSFVGSESGAVREVPLLYEQPPRPGGRNTWEVVGTSGRLTDVEVFLTREGSDGRRREMAYPIKYETRPRQGKHGETLLRAYVETDPPVSWENPWVSLDLAGGPDDVARASQLLSFHRAITEGAAPEYGAEDARTDLELLLALRESARRGSVPVDLPLREVTSHEQALHEEYRLTYGRDPLDGLEEAAAALFPRGGITHRVTHDRIGELLNR